MRGRFGLGIARDLKQHMNKFMRYESTCSAAEKEKRLYLYFEEETRDPPPPPDLQFYRRKRFPVRCVNLSYLLSPSSTNITDQFVPDLRHKPVRALHFLRPRRRLGGTMGQRGTVLLSAPAPGGGSRSYAAIESCSSRSKAKLSKTNITDELVPDLRERPLKMREDSTPRCRRWGGTFTSGPFLFGGSRSYAAIESCSLRSKPKVNNNSYPVIKRIKKDEFEFLFLDGEMLADAKLYSLAFNFYDNSNRNLLQVLDTNGGGNKSKWVSLGGPPPFPEGSQSAISSCVVCNNKLLLFWYPNYEGAYCFDVTQPEKGWSSAPPSWGRCIPFLDCMWSLLVEHEHDYLLLFTFGPDFVAHARNHRSIKVFLMSHQCDTFQPLNQPLQLPEIPDVPCDFWDLCDPPSTCTSLEHKFVHLGGKKICLVLHRFFYNRKEYTTPPGFAYMPKPQYQDRGTDKGYIILVTFEYEINIQSLDIEYRVLTVRNLEYTGKQDLKRKPSIRTTSVELAGAVVL